MTFKVTYQNFKSVYESDAHIERRTNGGKDELAIVREWTDNEGNVRRAFVCSIKVSELKDFVTCLKTPESDSREPRKVAKAEPKKEEKKPEPKPTPKPEPKKEAPKPAPKKAPPKAEALEVDDDLESFLQATMMQAVKIYKEMRKQEGK